MPARLGGLIRQAKYTIYCETEKRPISVVEGKEKALYFAYRHKVRNHDVWLIDEKGRKEHYDDMAWIYQCPVCGAKFDDDSKWVAHMSAGDSAHSTSPPTEATKQQENVQP